MTAASANSDRPVPRWLHIWAVATVVVTIALLVLGQFVTSFRAGMADPIWPTEPWYLFVVGWKEPDRGYLIEHSHRIAGWTVGVFAMVLAFGLWRGEPNKWLRWAGFLGLLVLLAGYGKFHGDLRARKDAVELTWPKDSIGTMAAGLVVLGAAMLGSLMVGARGAGVRLLGVVALVAVMIQGLLGGFRVRLDALFGPELAPIHGIFAQVVFCLLVSVAALCGRPVESNLPKTSRRFLGRLSFGLVAVLFVQLIWGALVRHRPDSLNQRLHLLTAFLAVAAAVWLIRAAMVHARDRAGFTAKLLGVLVALQIVLGVEAWMGKFGEEARAGTKANEYLAEAAPVTVHQARMRSAHTLVGTGVLAAAVVLALRVRSRAGNRMQSDSANDVWERAIAPEPALALSGKRP